MPGSFRVAFGAGLVGLGAVGSAAAAVPVVVLVRAPRPIDGHTARRGSDVGVMWAPLVIAVLMRGRRFAGAIT